MQPGQGVDGREGRPAAHRPGVDAPEARAADREHRPTRRERSESPSKYPARITVSGAGRSGVSGERVSAFAPGYPLTHRAHNLYPLYQ
jgi:hypothetical protein